MYAIPAETASQNMPFEKEDLPGPGKPFLLSFLFSTWKLPTFGIPVLVEERTALLLF